MGTKDSVKQRREQRIKALQERSAAGGPADGGTDLIWKEERITRSELPGRQMEAYEIDPEKAWKANPNPWESWKEEGDRDYKGSYVKRALPNASKLPPSRKNSLRNDLLWKGTLSLLVFSLVWLLFRYDNELTRTGQAYVKHALTNEMNFEAAAAWYKEVFSGAPSFIPIFDQSPNEAIGADGSIRLPVVAPLAEGVLVRTFAELLNGIELAGEPAAEVLAAEEGRVLLAESNETSSSIVIQHANKRVTVYGNLEQVNVEANDWVEAGDAIGRLSGKTSEEPNLLFFAVKQDGVYVDPLDVIPID